MHGQERKKYKARFNDPKISAALAQKALQWNALSKELLIRRKRLSPPSIAPSSSPPSTGSKSSGSTSKITGSAAETLKIVDKVLVVNPDPSHLWNHRRELLLQEKVNNKEDSDNTDDGNNNASDSVEEKDPSFQIRDELNLTAACLKRNPKTYSAWYHRKWSIRHWISLGCPKEGQESGNGGGEELLMSELGLCAEFLALDERNFHCWNYRRFVVAAIAAVANSGDDYDRETLSSRSLALDGSWSWTATSNNADDDASSTLEILMGPQLAAVTVKKID
eukprot:1053909-Ditylum_brightwellii.AAC.1